MFSIQSPPVVELPSFVIKVGDRLPGIEGFVAGAPGTLIPTASLRFEFWNKKGGQRKGGAAYIFDGDLNGMRYDWQAGDTDLAGDYLGVWKTFDALGRQTSYPAEGHVFFRIED